MKITEQNLGIYFFSTLFLICFFGMIEFSVSSMYLKVPFAILTVSSICFMVYLLFSDAFGGIIPKDMGQRGGLHPPILFECDNCHRQIYIPLEKLRRNIDLRCKVCNNDLGKGHRDLKVIRNRKRTREEEQKLDEDIRLLDKKIKHVEGLLRGDWSSENLKGFGELKLGKPEEQEEEEVEEETAQQKRAKHTFTKEDILLLSAFKNNIDKFPKIKEDIPEEYIDDLFDIIKDVSEGKKIDPKDKNILVILLEYIEQVYKETTGKDFKKVKQRLKELSEYKIGGYNYKVSFCKNSKKKLYK